MSPKADLVQTAIGRFPPLRLYRIQAGLAGALLIVAGITLLPAVASAGLVSFSVEAVVGPVPGGGPTALSFFNQQTITILVASDPALHNALGYDALIDYSILFDALYGTCTYTPPTGGDCSGSIEYEVASGLGFDTALGGVISEFSNNVGLIGPTSGVLQAVAGEYDVTATAFTVLDDPVSGEIVTPDTFGSSTGNFMVVDGDVIVLPEPGTMLLFLLAAFGWLSGFMLRLAAFTKVARVTKRFTDRALN